MYKIKFLDHLLTNKEGDVSTKVYKVQFFGDGLELEEVAKLWKVLGLKRIEEIELKGNTKKSIPEIIEMFYPDEIKHGNLVEKITDHDKEIKESLLKKYSEDEVNELKDDEPKEPRELTPEEKEKAHRAELRIKLTKAGKFPKKNALTSELEEMVSKL